MRNLKIYVYSFLSLFSIYVIMLLSSYSKNSKNLASFELNNFLPLLPTLILLPFVQLLWGSYVKRIYKNSDFDEPRWEKTLMRFSVTEVSISDSKKIYKMPFIKNLFPAEIVVDYTDENIIIKAPRRVMHYYKNG